MRAAVYTQYGPPENVSIRDIEKPVPKDHEVLLRIHASTVNRTDCGFRSAQYFISRFFSGLLRPKNTVLGNEFAGIVEACGKNVTAFQVGDKVFGYNDTSFGAHAEFLTMDANGPMATLPNATSFEDAAAISEGAHYALCDIRAANVTAGQDVLVNGATGGIGSAAVQLLKHFGCNVTAVCDTAHLDLVKSLGADTVIDYTKQDFTHSGQTFDFVFDAVGKSSFGKCKSMLKPHGIYISTELGKHSENVFLALLSPFKRGKRVLFPIPTSSQDDILFLKSLVESGAFKPVIDRKFPLENIVEAHTYVGKGFKTGNVVIVIS